MKVETYEEIFFFFSISLVIPFEDTNFIFMKWLAEVIFY